MTYQDKYPSADEGPQPTRFNCMKVMCFFCRGEAYNEEHQGVAYYRAKLAIKGWCSVPICIRCWKEKRGIKDE